MADKMNMKNEIVKSYIQGMLDKLNEDAYIAKMKSEVSSYPDLRDKIKEIENKMPGIKKRMKNKMYERMKFIDN